LVSPAPYKSRSVLLQLCSFYWIFGLLFIVLVVFLVLIVIVEVVEIVLFLHFPARRHILVDGEE
jgi:hypothetical protein